MSLLYDKLAEAHADARAILLGDIDTCRECGCDDNHACIGPRRERCSWFLLDVASPTGICTFCAHRLGADMPFICDAPIAEDRAA